MAGGSDKRQRNNNLLVRLDDEELATVLAKADRAGLAKAAFARAAMLGSPGPRAQRQPPVDSVLLRQVLGHLGRIGNNLNQIARAHNSGDPDDIAQEREAKQAVIEMRDALFTALNMKPSDHDHQRRQPRSG